MTGIPFDKSKPTAHKETCRTKIISGEENYLHRTLASVGVPPLHILRAHNGIDYRFYELTGDLPEALHFRHFEQMQKNTSDSARGRVRIKGEAKIEDLPPNQARGRVKLHG